MYKNYRLHRFNGLSTQNFEDASIQLVQIPTGIKPSVSIGCLHPLNFRNQFCTICQICS